MATYTVELKRVIESIYGTTMDFDDYTQEYHNVRYRGIEYGKLPTVSDWKLMGLGTYPIFDESYRDILNGKIVDEYFNREIGVETIDLFIWNIRKKMDQVMPFYNQLYLSETIQFDPLATYDLTTETSGNVSEDSSTEATSNATSSTHSDSRAVAQEMPQTMLAGNGDYATSASDSNSDTNAVSDNTNTVNANNATESNNKSTTKGFQGVASELLMRYRNSIINIDMMVINELSDCFMLVLNNGSDYSQNGWHW